MNRAKQADFNRKFVKQNKGCFGFIPLSRMPEKVSDKSVNHDLDYVEIHKKLRKDGRKNFEGLQLPIKSKLNYDKFAHYLRNYWDWQLPMFTKFGFPLDLDPNVSLESDLINHPSAINFPDHIEHYIAEEQLHDGLLGPFDTPPFPIHTSPFMSREKQESDRRVIVDLSWPKSGSVNNAVKDNFYVGLEYMLTLPTIDHVVRAVTKFGRGSYISKIDISRAFKHIPIDPGDIHHLGLHWNQYFIEKNLVFGFKKGSDFYQRLSDCVRFIMAQEGYYIINYLDDHLIFGDKDKCNKGFERLTVLLNELGLTINQKKNVLPSKQVVCLGILVDTENFTMSVPDKKMNEIRNLLENWKCKKSCSKNNFNQY